MALRNIENQDQNEYVNFPPYLHHLFYRLNENGINNTIQ